MQYTTNPKENILAIDVPVSIEKNLAYLLADTIMVQFRNKCVIVLTSIVVLQHQPIRKDSPVFEKICDLKITYS